MAKPVVRVITCPTCRKVQFVLTDGIVRREVGSPCPECAPIPATREDCDPLESLCRELRKTGRAFKEATGLNADEAATYIMARIRHQSIPEAILAKLRVANLDTAMIESVTADEVMRAIAAPFLGQPNPETVECVGDRLTMEGTLSIRYTLTQEDGKWFMEDADDLGLSGSADDNATPAQHVRAFLEDLLFAWDRYAVAPDSELTRTARGLKRRLLGLFGLEAEEDKK